MRFQVVAGPYQPYNAWSFRSREALPRSLVQLMLEGLRGLGHVDCGRVVITSRRDLHDAIVRTVLVGGIDTTANIGS